MLVKHKYRSGTREKSAGQESSKRVGLLWWVHGEGFGSQVVIARKFLMHMQARASFQTFMRTKYALPNKEQVTK